MNLRNYKGEYSIGLDMGTRSVGWCAVDKDGDLLHFKKQPTWGSRLFDSAQPASEARAHRSQRRRYVRRRWRLDLLQALFKDEMDLIDPDFFERINHSRTVEGDPIFNGSDFTKADYYKRFPTIYHLRNYLMETNEKADLRLVYLAIHNIVKHRGNFLREDDKNLKSANANPEAAAKEFFSTLSDWCVSHGMDKPTNKSSKLVETLRNKDGLTRSKLAEKIGPLVTVSVPEELDQKKFAKALANAMLGLSAEFKNIFGDFGIADKKTKISLGNEEDLEKLRAACPDECVSLLDALCAVYSAFVLQGLLSYVPGGSISQNMIAKYDQYKADLKALKALVSDYPPVKSAEEEKKNKSPYDLFFRGPTYHSLNAEDTSKDYSHDEAKGYTAYNLHKTNYDDFKKEVKEHFEGTGAESDPRYIDMMERFNRLQFLRRLKTSDNGAIYYQLHLEELEAIIKNQGRFYPFLIEDAQKIESLVSFRIPYYVGPLTSKTACKNAPKDRHGKNRFQWSERKPGMEEAVITPWNWDQIIDKNKSAENFIMRMTGDCTYLAGEKTLPRCSLLYEEFCVLNELNGMRWSEDGDHWERFDAAQREGIARDLLSKTRSVTYKKIEDWLIREDGAAHPHVKGAQGTRGMQSRLGSLIFFTKDVLHVDTIAPGTKLYNDVETIIKWNTLFEDRSILKEKLESEFGSSGSGLLNTEQIKAICKKRFTGWGRLSKEFLTGLKVDTQNARKVSIMDVLRDGNPNSTRRNGDTMVMMEVLRDKDLGFQKAVDVRNRAYYADRVEGLGVNDLPGSPAIRRSINQAIRIVDEIVSIAGHAPSNIFIEETYDEDEEAKGKRTKTRYDQLLVATNKFKEECCQLYDQECMNDLKVHQNDLADDRLYLYFSQHGKCLYSGEEIDINHLLDDALYEVDHIIPRAYVKDDSLENKALVCRNENQRKTNELLIDPRVKIKMSDTWRRLHQAGLIGDKKYRNLTRPPIGDNENLLKGFIARQLVETSQMVKLTQSLLEARYANEETKIVPVKASMSHNLREAAGFVKCREANDFHHAHDAYLACRIGLFIQMRHPGIYDNPIGYTRMMQNYVRSQAAVFNRTHQMPGSAGFVINSFLSSGFNKETGEIFKDQWDAEAELNGMRRALNCRQCYISRMPQEDTGAFWKATIYSPRNPKMGPKLALSVKKDLPAKQYGGFSSQQSAYFFIYEAKTKGNSRFQFAEVPVWLASRVGVCPEALADYARELAEADKPDFVRIVRPKILKKQLIELNGNRLFITGGGEVRNARELSVEHEFLRTVCCAWDFVDKQRPLPAEFNERADNLLEILTMRSKAVAWGLMEKIPQMSNAASIRALHAEDKAKLLLQFLNIVNGSNRQIDLSKIGGAKTAGQYKVTFSKELNDPDTSFYIIDQSVTGMFERKTRVGL